MKVHFHVISFKHSCGLEGTILEIAIRADGTMSIGGLCAVCGEEFSQESRWADLMASCAVMDYERKCKEMPEEVLADFVPTGRPS